VLSVVCTGRGSVAGTKQSDYEPETIEETAELVTELGGVGIRSRSTISISRRCYTLAERMIRREHGAIDVLVNVIWGAEILKGTPPTWNRACGCTTSTTGCASGGWASTST
jgi:hypothetical protein